MENMIEIFPESFKTKLLANKKMGWFITLFLLPVWTAFLNSDDIHVLGIVRICW